MCALTIETKSPYTGKILQKYNEETLVEVKAKIAHGEKLLLAGDENLLKQLPAGNWIGGSIPYFMTEQGGLSTRQKIYVTELPESVSNVSIKKVSKNGNVEVSSRFHMMELRRDDVRHFAGSYLHKLKKTKSGYAIQLQRVDMTNAQAAYDYVLQVWV